MSDVAQHVDELTAGWFEHIFLGAGIETSIDDVEIRAIGTGQIGASYRVRPTYRTQGGAPETFVVKMAAGDQAMRDRLSGGFVKEVGFYSTLASTVSARIPACWHSALAADNATFTLLLEDLSPSVPGVQKRGCSLAQARDALGNLAGVHAPRWNDAALMSLEFLTPADEATAMFLEAIYVDAANGFVARFGDRLSEEDRQTIVDVGRVLASWQLQRPHPFSVVHGDYRLDNLMFPLAGDGVAVLDWQTVTVGPPSRDLAYFLGNSIETDVRREHERDLVAVYVDALRSLGVDYAFDSCFDDYRLGQLQGPMITVLGCMFASAGPSADSDAMFLAMATRSCAAIRDLGSLALVTQGAGR